MPIHDLGYRAWNGKRSARMVRWLTVAKGGIQLILKRKWLRFMLLVAWLPVVFPAMGIFAFEYSSTDPGIERGIVQVISGPLGQPELGRLIIEDPDLARHQVWSALILAFFRYPQLFAMVTLIGLIAPLLVSYDLRTKAYLMYFSRPLTPTEYIVGKSAVIWFLLIMIVSVPATLLYIFGILLSPDLSVILQTWDIPLRIAAASVVLLVPTTMLAVLYSAFTAESRYATFAWFATWAMGFVSYQILTYSAIAFSGQAPRGPRRNVNWEEMGVDVDRWRFLSPYHCLGKVQSWVFGLDTTAGSVVPSLSVLLLITIVGFVLVRRRIVARLSI